MTVFLRRGQLNWFRKKARNSPNEVFAYLVGRVINASAVEVHYFAYPTIDFASPGEIHTNHQSDQDIYAEAEAEGLRVCGSIHSHPNWCPVMSGTDYEGFAAGERVVGIVEVAGRKTRVVFWSQGTPLPCAVKYF